MLSSNFFFRTIAPNPSSQSLCEETVLWADSVHEELSICSVLSLPCGLLIPTRASSVLTGRVKLFPMILLLICSSRTMCDRRPGSALSRISASYLDLSIGWALSSFCIIYFHIGKLIFRNWTCRVLCTWKMATWKTGITGKKKKREEMKREIIRSQALPLCVLRWWLNRQPPCETVLCCLVLTETCREGGDENRAQGMERRPWSPKDTGWHHQLWLSLLSPLICAQLNPSP